MIDSTLLEKVELPYLLLSAATFRSNHFINNFFLIVSSNEIISKNLATGNASVLKQPDTRTYFKEATIITKKRIRLQLSNEKEVIVSLETLTAVN